MEQERPGRALWEIPTELTIDVLEREPIRAGLREPPRVEEHLGAARGVLFGSLFGGLLWVVILAGVWQVADRDDGPLAMAPTTEPAAVEDLRSVTGAAHRPTASRIGGSDGG